MTKETVLVFIFEGFADWEASYAMSGISKSNRFCLKTIATEKSPLRSMGGLTVYPDLDLRPGDERDLDLSNTALLLLPGGVAWEEGRNGEIAELVRHCVAVGIPVAGICGATLLLARLGLLDGREHTSNDEAYLRAFVPDYHGSENYRQEPSVVSRGIVTAAGTAALEFAENIFDVLEIADNQAVREWFGYFQNKIVSC